MHKKFVLPLILALVTTLAFSNVAYAATSAPATSTTRYVGTIISIDATTMTFKLNTVNGKHPTIHVDSNTQYKGLVSKWSDLAMSMSVNVQTTKQSNGDNLATSINVLKQYKSSKLTGRVAEVDSTSFNILGTDGQTYTFAVTKKTTFSGFGVAALIDLKVGMNVKVTYLDLGTGSYRAEKVVVTQAYETVSGKITDKGSGTFTILSGTKAYTFDVTSKTTYTGLGVTSFSGLKADMRVTVNYVVLADGTLRAVAVTVRAK